MSRYATVFFGDEIWHSPYEQELRGNNHLYESHSLTPEDQQDLSLFFAFHNKLAELNTMSYTDSYYTLELKASRILTGKKTQSQLIHW